MKTHIVRSIALSLLFCGAAYGGDASHSGKITITLLSSKDSRESCKIFWSVNNSTKQNITTIDFDPTYKERDGTILGKFIFQAQRLKGGATVEGYSRMNGTKCSEIAQIKLNGMHSVQVDGDRVTSNALFNTIENSIAVTSNIGNTSFVK